MSLSTAEWTAAFKLRAALRTGEAQRLRKAHGLSLGEVARRLGTSPSAVLRWEHGERTPRDNEVALRYWKLLQQLRRMPVGQAS